MEVADLFLNSSIPLNKPKNSFPTPNDCNEYRWRITRRDNIEESSINIYDKDDIVSQWGARDHLIDEIKASVIENSDENPRLTYSKHTLPYQKQDKPYHINEDECKTDSDTDTFMKDIDFQCETVNELIIDDIISKSPK